MPCKSSNDFYSIPYGVKDEVSAVKVPSDNYKQATLTEVQKGNQFIKTSAQSVAHQLSQRHAPRPRHWSITSSMTWPAAAAVRFRSATNIEYRRAVDELLHDTSKTLCSKFQRIQIVTVQWLLTINCRCSDTLQSVLGPSTFLDLGSGTDCPKTLFRRRHFQVSGADWKPFLFQQSYP